MSSKCCQLTMEIRINMIRTHQIHKIGQEMQGTLVISKKSFYKTKAYKPQWENTHCLFIHFAGIHKQNICPTLMWYHLHYIVLTIQGIFFGKRSTIIRKASQY